MRETCALTAQCIDLVGLELRCVDLGDLKRQEVAPPLALLGHIAQALQLSVELAQRRMPRDHRLPSVEQAAAAIEQLAVHLGTQQTLRLVLARDLEAPGE